ncbi:MAG: cytochrome c biogenesis protein DipZ [Nitrospirae bacterium]|nr:cytochrome c biogenesis protein DipZ [Candidatus Manganitrophaceae bacterium]
MNGTLGILAIIAGGLTVLSPCILPILPPLLSASVSGNHRHRPFWIVLGLAISFTGFGVIFSLFGTFLGLSNAMLRDAALILLFFFAFTLLWPSLWAGIGVRISALVQLIPGMGEMSGKQTAVSSLLLGASLGLIWAPCAGPILGIILTLAAVQSSFAPTLLLMAAYSLGAAVPMLMIGYGGRRISERVTSLRKWGPSFHKALGALTLATVVALFFNLDTLLLAKLPGSLFVANQIEKQLTGTVNTPSDPGSAFGPDSALAANKKSPYPVLGTMPEFAEVTTWLNSPPLTKESLRGKVVLIDFWTYSCINCIRTLPAVTRWDEKYRDQGLVIVGVHTPEFQFEKEVGNIKSAIVRHGIKYPVAVDNDYGTWKAYHNQFWPAKYLIDAEGKLRLTHFGEGDEDVFEQAIQSVLMEAKLLHRPVAVDETKRNADLRRIHSPETYVGYSRASNFFSNERMALDTTTNYTPPPALRLNDWALGGTWKVADEAAILQAPGGKIQFRFQAPKLNLVMKGSDKGIPAKVLVDGAPIPADMRGSDVGADGKTIIKDARLYNLITLPKEDDAEHLFEMIFENPSVELYAFTFG